MIRERRCPWKQDAFSERSSPRDSESTRSRRVSWSQSIDLSGLWRRRFSNSSGQCNSLSNDSPQTQCPLDGSGLLRKTNVQKRLSLGTEKLPSLSELAIQHEDLLAALEEASPHRCR